MIEVGRSRPHAGSPPKAVDRARMDSGLGEPQGELAVEEREPADVGQDDEPWPAFTVGQRMMCAEAIAVFGRKDEPTLSDHLASAGATTTQPIKWRTASSPSYRRSATFSSRRRRP